MTLAAEIRATTSVLTFAEHWDHFLARWAINRMRHRVEPGLYSLGNPIPESPVFGTANYTLSFDALRSALKGIDGYILVLDTQGINVWCAAGKGTFGTDELVKRIEVGRQALRRWLRRRATDRFEEDWIAALRKVPDDPDRADDWLGVQSWSRR